MHADYYHFGYSINFKKCKLSNLSGLRSRYNRLTNGKKTYFSVRKILFQSGWSNGVKLWAFDALSGTFPDKATADDYFADEVVVQCVFADIKILF